MSIIDMSLKKSPRYAMRTDLFLRRVASMKMSHGTIKADGQTAVEIAEMTRDRDRREDRRQTRQAQDQAADPPYLVQLLKDHPELTREQALEMIREAGG